MLVSIYIRNCFSFYHIFCFADVMHAGGGIHKLEVEALVQEDVQPQLQLKNAAVVLKPTEAKVSPLSATRDVIPDGRQVYQNLLVYSLSVTKPAEVALYAPIFNDLLYESEFESQMWMLFDANKALVATGDAHSQTFYTKLEKGDYTIRLQVRHEARAAGEDCRSQPSGSFQNVKRVVPGLL